MLPLRDENPHPPGFKPKITIALIIINVIVFGIEVAITGQFIEFSNYEAMNMFLNWGAVPGCVTGQIDGINTGAEIINCPAIPETDSDYFNIHAWRNNASWRKYAVLVDLW